LLQDLFDGVKHGGKAVTADTKQASIRIASRMHSALAPLLDTVDGIYLSGEGVRATVQAAAQCANEINAALRDGTPLRTLVDPRSTGHCRCGECGRLAPQDEIVFEASLHQVCNACRQPEPTKHTSIGVSNPSGLIAEHCRQARSTSSTQPKQQS
jgi:hypothetical protein